LAGDSLEGLLEQVRREHGDRARIVEANKCRKGGFAGFFARETYEVVIELDDAPDATAASTATSAATGQPVVPGLPHVTSVLELADAINEIERATTPINVLPTGESAAEAPATSDGSVSTETEAFAALLERLSRDVDPFEVEAERLLTPKPAPAPTATASAPPFVAAPVAPVEPRVSPSPVAPTPVAPTPFAPLAGTGISGTGIGPVRPTVVPALARLGLPEPLCTPAGERDIRIVLAERLRTLPAPPPLPNATGAVLAVVGDADRALGLARDVAQELGLDPGDVLLATPDAGTSRVPAWLRLDNRDTAAERRRSWWRRDRLTLVAVDACFGVSPHWGRRMLDALEPTLTWGVVEATWKPEDIERWSDSLGGVDSLAVQNVRATVSPAAILGVDVPVARLDGSVATPTVWSSLLAERLAA
jgi:hypothetical protein